MPTTTTTTLLLRVKLINSIPSWWSVLASGNQPLLWLLGQTTQTSLQRKSLGFSSCFYSRCQVWKRSLPCLHSAQGQPADDEGREWWLRCLACQGMMLAGWEGGEEKCKNMIMIMMRWKQSRALSLQLLPNEPASIRSGADQVWPGHLSVSQNQLSTHFYHNDFRYYWEGGADCGSLLQNEKADFLMKYRYHDIHTAASSTQMAIFWTLQNLD